MPVHKGDIFKELDRIKKAVAKIPTQAASIAKNFFVEGFAKQGWQGDSGLEAWIKRKDSNNDRPLLIAKGNLRKSLIKVVSGSYIAVKVSGQAAKYADVHNFGFKGTVTVKGKNKTFTRQMNVPKRQFIGNSKQLDEKIKKFIEAQLTKK